MTLDARQDWVEAREGQAGRESYPPSITLRPQSILASCIRQLSAESSKQEPDAIYTLLDADKARHMTPSGPPAAGPADRPWKLTHAELDFLKARNYRPLDVERWAAIIISRSSYRAACLFAAGRVASPDDVLPDKRPAPIPTFVLLFLLRRQRISARALQILLAQAWTLVPMKGHISGKTGFGHADLRRQPIQASEDSRAMIVLFIRLLRHARKVMPQALPVIASLFTTAFLSVCCQDTTGSSKRSGYQDISKLTFLCNRALSLLSLPAQLGPYKANPYHERAQFHLIERMAEHKPPITITKEGYRAVTRTQLAHKKSATEGNWARLKASSWPPWKEDKMGIDAHIGPEYGISRARQSINRMQEAGYKPDLWEDVASIYSGWDTDNTPTIQTRISLPTASYVPSQDLDKSDTDSHRVRAANAEIWAARIRATRTLREAWACFLAYGDHKLPPQQAVYFAMFEKIKYHGRYRRMDDSKSRTSESNEQNSLHIGLPGDGREVHPDPPYMHDAVYVPSDPPSLEELFDQMMSKGIKPTGRCLAFLVRYAISINQGLKFLQAGGKAEVEPSTLGPLLFTSLITLLCQFSRVRTLKFDREVASSHVGSQALAYRFPIKYAYHLMYKVRPQYLPPWNFLLWTLATNEKSAGILANSVWQREPDELVAMRVIRDVLRLMETVDLEIDFEGFRWLCVGMQKAVIACKEIPHPDMDDGKQTLHKPRDATSSHLQIEVAELLNKGSRYMRTVFNTIVGDDMLTSSQPSGDPQRPISRLAAVPDAIHLHAYVRTLGYLRDFEGIFSLVQWMTEFWPEIEVAIHEAQGGLCRLRRTFVAIRAFLECSWEDLTPAIDHRGQVDRNERFGRQGPGDDVPEELAVLLRKAIEDVSVWGGWPTDEEVVEYCEYARRMAQQKYVEHWHS